MSDTITSAMFAEPRRRIGTSERQLGRTLLAWRAAGHLAGDEHAAARSTLRDAARAVDNARAALEDGGSPYTLSTCVKTYAALLTQFGPTPTGPTHDDPLDALLNDLSAPAPHGAQP